MADKRDKRSDDAEALSAMADGAEAPSSDPPAQQLADLEAQSGVEVAGPHERSDAAESAEVAAVAEIAEATDPLAAQANWRAAVQRQTRAAYAHQYKRTMLPLLLVVGLLLLVLSTATLVMLVSAAEPDPYHMQSYGTILQKYGKWTVLIALPLAVLLLLGAWLFHRDLRRLHD